MLQIEFDRVDENPECTYSRLIWEWRNDAVTRHMSRTTDLIPWENHKAWYAKAAKDPRKVILMTSVQHVPTCMVRFDYIDKESAEINFNMNPAMRGKGLGKPILIEACTFGFNTLHLTRISAEIKPENTPSIKIFEGAGFIFQGEQMDFYAYDLKKDDLK
jgi:RimJ/RimL family protein N-acetyltransferase